MKRVLNYAGRSIRRAHDIIFYVNGVEHSIEYPDVETKLVRYLRLNDITSPKISCNDGVCGSCTVVYQDFNEELDSLNYRAVNACKIPLLSVDGKHVLTAELFKELEDPIFESIVDLFVRTNASQCGFCTPGFEMHLYALLKTGQFDVIEEYINGNQCRCTGYRPILHSVNILKEEFGQVDLISDPIEYPKKLRDYESRGKRISTRGLYGHADWIIPKSIEEVQEVLLNARLSEEEVDIISGGAEVSRQSANRNTMLYVGDIPHLKKIEEVVVKGEKMIRIGSSVKLEHLYNFCKERREEGGDVFKVLETCLRRLGTPQIRNTGSALGNIFSKYHCAEILLILELVEATVHILNSNGEIRSLKLRDEEEGLVVEPDEILIGVDIPAEIDDEKEMLIYFKEAKRKMVDVPLVNLGVYVRVGDGDGGGERIIKEIRLLYDFEGNDFHLKDQTKNTRKIYRLKVMEELLTNMPLSVLWNDGKKEGGPWTFSSALKSLPSELRFWDQLPNIRKKEVKKVLLGSLLKKTQKYMVRRFGGEENEVENSIFHNHCTPDDTPNFNLHNTTVKFEEVVTGTCLGSAEENIYAEPMVRGEAVFLDDIPKASNELMCYIITSKVAKGRIVKMDYSDCLKIPGVHAFISHETIEEFGGTNVFGSTSQGIFDEEVLVSKQVTCVGQPIGAIVADTWSIAHLAETKLVLEIEEAEDAIFTIDDAIEKESYYPYYPQLKKGGDVESALRKSQNRTSGSFEMGGQDHTCGETHISIAIPKENGEMEVIASCQSLLSIQKFLTKCMNVPFNKVVAKVKRLGGSYGGKQNTAVMFSIINALAARKTGRPTRCRLTRKQDMSWTGGRHPYKAFFDVGYTDEGKIEALKIDVYSNSGHVNDLSLSIMDKAMLNMDQAYTGKIDTLEFNGWCMKTNTLTNTAYRGFGAPQSQLSMESVIEKIICELRHKFGDEKEVDPYEVRRINMYENGEETPYGKVLTDAHTLNEIYEHIHTFADYEEQKEEVAEFNKKNKYVKRGIHILPTKSGMGMTNAPFYNAGNSLVHIYLDGSVLVSTGGIEMGQGIQTKCAQVAAGILEIPLSRVHVLDTSTEKTPNNPSTSASIGSDVFCGAVEDAARQLKTRLQPTYNQIGMEWKKVEGSEEVSWENCWEEVVTRSYFNKIDLSAHGFYELRHITPIEWNRVSREEMGEEAWAGRPRLLGDPNPYFIYGAVCATVEIDCLSGAFKVIRADMVQDCGNSLNPLLDIGQVEGSFIQGMGWVTLEEVIHDPELGLYNNDFMKYKVPLADNCPKEFNVELFPGHPSESGYNSSKTAGEPPFFFGSAVFWAIKDAVRAYRIENGLGDEVDFEFFAPATKEMIRLACKDEIVDILLPNDFMLKRDI